MGRLGGLCLRSRGRRNIFLCGNNAVPKGFSGHTKCDCDKRM